MDLSRKQQEAKGDGRGAIAGLRGGRMNLAQRRQQTARVPALPSAAHGSRVVHSRWALPHDDRPNTFLGGDLTSFSGRRASAGPLIGTLIAIALAAFSLGVAASRVQSHYARQADCLRWQANVNRWADVVSNAPGQLTTVETTAMLLARGGMIATRDQACGY